MKKILSVILSVSLLLGTMPVLNGTVYALESEWEYEKFTYDNQTDDTSDDILGVVLTKYLGTQTDIYLPDDIEVDGELMPVLKIGKGIFENNDAINSVTLSDSVRVIGERAFYDADNLVCIVTNEKLAELKSSAFGSCDNFNSVILYENVAKIGEDAFADCPKLVIYGIDQSRAQAYARENGIEFVLIGASTEPEIHVIGGVTYYVTDGRAIAVSYDGSVSNVVIPATVNGYPVTEIREKAFQSSTAVRTVKMSNTVKSIGVYAFSGCTNLYSVTLSDSLVDIGNYAFQNCTSLSGIIIGANVKTIGNNVFAGCSVLKSAVISEGVESIGNYAFYQCKALKEATLPESVTYLGIYIFYQCSALESANIPKNITVVPTSMFYGCTALKNVSLHDGITTIKSTAFRGCSSLETIDLPESLTKLESSVFYECKSLTAIEIPDGITDIPGSAFYGCGKLTSVSLPKNLKTIGYQAFSVCSTLASITIPDGVTSIGTSAFDWCPKLSSVTIPDSVTTIESRAFYCSHNLVRVIIPPTVTSMDKISFSTSTTLCVVRGSYAHSFAVSNKLTYEVYNEIKQYNVDGMTFMISGSRVIPFSFDNSRTEVVVPDTVEGYPVTDIGSIFRGSSVTSVTLPKTVRVIAEHAFRDCTALKSITLEDTVTTLSNNAFYNCTSLESVHIKTFEQWCNLSIDGYYANPLYYAKNLYVNGELVTELTIPESVKAIKPYAFAGGNFTKVIMHDAITSIGKNAFFECKFLTSALIPQSAKTIGDYAFSSCESLVEVGTIPSLSIGIFKNCTSLESAVLSEKVTSIPERAFSGCTNLSDIAVPDSVTSIGQYAFYGCTSFKNIVLPDGITSIGEGIFQNCSGLLTVKLPEGIATITRYMFNGCTSIKEITIPNTVTLISENAFAGCKGLVTVVMQDNVGRIANYAFSGCSALENVTFSAALTSIGNSAFQDTTSIENVYISDVGRWCGIYYADTTAPPLRYGANLYVNNELVTDLVIPEGTTYISKYAFSGCKSIKSVTIPGSIETIDTYTFKGCPNLETIVIADGVKNMKDYAFAECKKLKSVRLPSTLEGVGYEAFGYCSVLETVIIPDGVKSIGAYAFRYCYALKNITIPASVKSIGSYAFYVCNQLTGVTLSEGIETIGLHAFGNCSRLSSVKIPKSVTSMDKQAFPSSTTLYVYNGSHAYTVAVNNGLRYRIIADYGDYTLSFTVSGGKASVAGFEGTAMKVTIPDTFEGYPVTSIGSNAFDGCSGITELTMPESITSIGSYAFRDCIVLKKINLPETLRTIGSYAFSGCRELIPVNIPDSVTSIGNNTFSGCVKFTEVTLPKSLTTVNSYIFRDCTNLEKVTIPEGVTVINSNAFTGCTAIKKITIPESVTRMYANSFPTATVLCVYEDSYAHSFAKTNSLLFFVIRKTANPEINFGLEISGKVTASNGSILPGAFVEMLYDDGTVKADTTADENGFYEFPYIEVGRYTMRATDLKGAVGMEPLSVKRMNVFDVYVAGDTNITVNTANKISGTVSQNNVTVSVTDENGNMISSIQITDGNFEFDNIPNGTYVIKADNEAGSAAEEIKVFNGDVTGIVLTIVSENSSITGLVKDEDGNTRTWASVTVYNSSGIQVAKGKTDENGRYAFSALSNDEYAIVAESNEIKKHNKYDYDRSVVLKGYGYIEITEVGSYTLDDIIVVDELENDSKGEIKGKITVNGKSKPARVIVSDVFRRDFAVVETKNNGHFNITNVPDGLYFITALSDTDGMGFSVVIVRKGETFGNTHIKIAKSERIAAREREMSNIPYCSSRDEALLYKDKIVHEKEQYDKLSKKEKQQLSKEYTERLERLVEWISNTEYEVKGDEEFAGTVISNGGLISTPEEIENEDTVQIEITIEKAQRYEIGENGVQTDDEFVQQMIEDNTKDKELGQYYNILMRKGNNGKYYEVDNIQKDTETSGKLRITMPVPKQYKGHKHYSVVHIHNGEAMVLADLDDDPDTITFEIDKFSTFALCYSDIETFVEVPDDVNLMLTNDNVSLSGLNQTAVLVLASYNTSTLVDIKSFDVSEDTEMTLESTGLETNGANTVKAFLWNSLDGLTPVCAGKSINIIN